MSGTEGARAWVDHLLAGGAQPWLAFRDAAAPHDTAPEAAHARWQGLVPGAQNLELLRRLNAAGPVPEPVRHEVLRASLPGRGRPDLRLLGDGEARWGAPPVDPAVLGEDELLRAAVGALADRVAALGEPSVRTRRPRRWARQYELVGDPWRAAEYRSALVADGRRPGGPARHVVVLGAPLEEMVRGLWVRRAFGSGVGAWDRWLHGLVRRDELPGQLDLPALARRGVEQVGARRVHVVLDPAALPRFVGTRRLPPPAELPSGSAAELARQISTALGNRVQPAARRTLMWQVVRPALAAAGPGSAPQEHLPVPEVVHAWLAGRAAVLARELQSGAYSVHGQPETLLPQTPEPGATAPPGLRAGQVGHAESGALALAEHLLRLPDWPQPATGVHTGGRTDEREHEK